MSDVPLKASDNSDESLGLTSAKVNHLVAEKNDNLPESNRKLRSHTTPLSEESRVSALATKSPRFVGLDTDIIEARAAEVPSETRDDGHSVMDGPSSQLLNQGGNGGNELPSHGGSDVVGNQNGGAPSMESVAQPHHPTGENNKKERTSVPPQLRQLDTQNPTPRKKRGITPMDPTPASDRTPRRTHVHITVNDLAATVTSNTIHNSDDSMDSKPLMREMDFLKECILDLEQSSKNIAEKEGLGDKELTLKSPRPHITRSIQTIKEVLSLSARIHEEMISLNSREKQLAESEASLKDERNVFENEKNSTDFVTLKTEMERVQAQNVEILGLLNKFLEKQTDSEAHGAKRHAEDAFGDEELPDKGNSSRIDLVGLLTDDCPYRCRSFG